MINLFLIVLNIKKNRVDKILERKGCLINFASDTLFCYNEFK